jgi:hypothetical protein
MVLNLDLLAMHLGSSQTRPPREGGMVIRHVHGLTG